MMRIVWYTSIIVISHKKNTWLLISSISSCIAFLCVVTWTFQLSVHHGFNLSLCLYVLSPCSSLIWGLVLRRHNKNTEKGNSNQILFRYTHPFAPCYQQEFPFLLSFGIFNFRLCSYVPSLFPVVSLVKSVCSQPLIHSAFHIAHLYEKIGMFHVFEMISRIFYLSSC